MGVEVAGNLGSRSPRRSFRKPDHRERPWGGESKAEGWVGGIEPLLNLSGPYVDKNCFMAKDPVPSEVSDLVCCLSVLPEERNGSEGSSLWRESQGSLNSSASLDLGFLSSCATSSSQTEVSASGMQAFPTPMTDEVRELVQMEKHTLNAPYIHFFKNSHLQM